MYVAILALCTFTIFNNSYIILHDIITFDPHRIMYFQDAWRYMYIPRVYECMCAWVKVSAGRQLTSSWNRGNRKKKF